jgi:DNA polymerase IIIc chi subunit
MVSVCCVQLSAIHKHLDEMDERLDTMQNEVFLPHGDQAVADDDANNNTATDDNSLLRDYDDMVTII